MAAARRRAWAMAMVPAVLSACGGFDPAASLEKSDYQALAGRRAVAPQTLIEPPVPALVQPVATPLPPPESVRRVTLLAERPTPVADVLVELARVADVDLDLETGVTGSVVMAARDRPLPEVVERLADLGGLDLRLERGVLRAAPDRPRPQTYRLDALNLSRAAESSVATSTDVFTRVSAARQGASAAGGAGNASESKISSTSSTDVWGEVAAGLTQILGVGESGGGPRGDDSKRDAPGPSFHIHRQAGVLTVVGSRHQHRQVADYLRSIREAMASQVLIEAKILEVTLADQYRGGIDWQALSEGGDFFLNFPGTEGVISAPLTDSVATLTLGGGGTLGGMALSTLVQFINRFGVVRTLSSPRMTVMNNQTAVLKVAENEVYFVIDVDTTTNDSVSRTTYSSQINTVPIGLVMTVQPSIEPGSGRVTLGLRPTVSRIASRVSDPAVALQSDAVESLIPVVEVRELDSVVTLDNGAVVVMGGLMQERLSRTQRGLPWLEDLPGLGRLFRTDLVATDVVELVVLLRATVIGGTHLPTPDRMLYDRFGPDPRPF